MWRPDFSFSHFDLDWIGTEIKFSGANSSLVNVQHYESEEQKRSNDRRKCRCFGDRRCFRRQEFLYDHSCILCGNRVAVRGVAKAKVAVAWHWGTYIRTSWKQQCITTAILGWYFYSLITYPTDIAFRRQVGRSEWSHDCPLGWFDRPVGTSPDGQSSFRFASTIEYVVEDTF